MGSTPNPGTPDDPLPEGEAPIPRLQEDTDKMQTPLPKLPPGRVRLFRLSKVPGFNVWKNPVRKVARQASKLVPRA